MNPIPFLVLLLLVPASFGAGIEGKWAGVLEAPGSIAAIRLNITDIQGVEGSSLFVNVYGNETVAPVKELTIKGDEISFKSELSREPASFVGKLAGDAVTGTVSVSTGGAVVSAKWNVRRFDYSTLDKPAPPGGPGGPYELPTPTGGHQIGRRTFYWTNGERKIYAQFWYPAEDKRKSTGAPYIENLGDKPSLRIVRSIRTHAKTDVPIARSKTAFPTIVFTPGLGSSIARYTAIIENLVSHGYAVVAVNPAGDAGEYTLPDGRVQLYNAEIWDQPVSETWTAEKRKVFFDERRHGWASDMSFALDQLKQMFPTGLDLDNAGALGHSYGGQAVSIACANDTRFKACANLDGLAQGAAFLPNQKGVLLKQPFLFFSKNPVATDYELALMGLTRTEYDRRDRQRMLESWKPSLKTRLEALDQGTYFAVARGATHQSFADGPLMEANHPREILGERHRTMRDINRYILAFFDKVLTKKNTSLLEPDVKVVVEFLKRK